MSEYGSNHKFMNLSELTVSHECLNNDESIKEMMEYDGDNFFSFKQIQKLTLTDFGADLGDEEGFNANTFVKFLCRFSNVTHLTLKRIHLDFCTRNSINITGNTMPMLKHLNCAHVDANMYTGRLIIKLIDTHSTRLQSLAIGKKFVTALDVPNLNDLRIMNMTGTPLDYSFALSLTANCRDLKQLTLDGKDACFGKMGQIVIDSLQKRPGLNSLTLFSSKKNGDMDKCISALEFGLFENKHVPRDSLRIIIGFHQDESIEYSTINQIGCYISRIVNVLDASNIEKYKLIFEIPKKIDNEAYRKKLIDYYNDTHAAMWRTREQKGVVVISQNYAE